MSPYIFPRRRRRRRRTSKSIEVPIHFLFLLINSEKLSLFLQRDYDNNKNTTPRLAAGNQSSNHRPE